MSNELSLQVTSQGRTSNKTIRCDVHTHTLFSRHAYSTVEENLRAAKAQDLELLGITDHFSCMLFDRPSLKNFQYFLNLEIWPRNYEGVEILHGCEADIVNLEGGLFGEDIPTNLTITEVPTSTKSLAERVFRGRDYIIASVHDKSFTTGATPAQNAQMYIKALEHPKVLILGHIGRSGVDFELDPVLIAARDMGKLIEINETSLTGPRKDRSLGPCRKILERAAELSCPISFGSDAHISMELGHAHTVESMIKEIDFPLELVSCTSKEKFLSYLTALPQASD